MSTISNTRLIISILQQIPRQPGSISINELRDKIFEHEGLDIPIRNMQRYLSQVKGHFGLDCKDSDSGNANMWFVENIERRNPNRQIFPTTQSISYLIAQKVLENDAPRAVTKQMDNLFKQAHFSLREKGKGFERWNKKVKVIKEHLPIVKQSVIQEVIDTAMNCLIKEVQMELVYKAQSDEHPKKHIVSPVGLIVKGSSQHLVCIDERSATKMPMNFLINGILECLPIDRKIDEDYLVGNNAFDINAFSQKARFESPMEFEDITLIAEITPELWHSLSDQPISENQKLASKTNGNLDNKILSATLPNTKALKRWILGHAENIRILEPQSLHDDIQESCTKAANNYRPFSEQERKKIS